MSNEHSNGLVLPTEEDPDKSTLSAPNTESKTEDAKAELTGEEILQRMAKTRLLIDEHADELGAQVSALSDWRSYVRRHPWLSVSAAAAIGFVIVPSRAKPDTEEVARSSGERTTSSAAEELRSVLIGAAKKAATSYASKSLSNAMSGFLDFEERK